MANENVFKGFKQVNGTVENFSVDSLENGYLYFVRTNADKTDGFLYFNGRKYATAADALANAKSYVDTEVANAIASASTSANTLHEAITALTESVETSVETLNNAITAETQARENAITAETEARENAITALTEAVETSANTLNNAITAETQARENAIADLEDKLASATTETEALIQEKIEALTKEDEAVEGQYVSSVSEENGVITVSRETIPVQSVSGDSYVYLTVGSGQTKAQIQTNITLMCEITDENSGEGTLVDAADVKSYIDEKAAASNTKVAEAADDKVISVTSAVSEDDSVTYSVASTLKLNYVSPSEQSEAKIQILGKDDALVSEIDATAFVKDSFLKEVTMVKTAEEGVTETAPYFKFIWNTVNGDGEGNVTSAITRISVADFIDTYTVAEGSTSYMEIGNYEVSLTVDSADGLASHNALTAETQARENAITALTEAVETSANTLNNAITALTEAVETSANTLNNAITAETEARENAITALTKTVEDEVDRAMAAESALTDDLATEVQAREDADKALEEKIDDLDKASYSGVTSTGKTLVVGELDENNQQNLEVNLEEATEDTVAAGHIEIKKNDNGALFGVLYVTGDDVD